MILQLEEAIADLWSGYYENFASNVVYNLTYNDSSKIVTFEFIDVTGLAQSFNLKVFKAAYNQTGDLICNKTLYSASGTLTCNLTNQTGDLFARAYISRSPPIFIDGIGIFVTAIKDILGASGILVSLLIIITIALIGSWNPAAGVMLTAFAVLMMKILGFVAFTYTSVILIFIVAIILSVRLKT